jgi:DNA-binding beta-propeller fold protein YncE
MRTPFAVALLVAVTLAGCGSEPVRDLPPGAEPAASPPLRRSPAGRIVPIDRTPAGVDLATPGWRAATTDGRLIAVVRPRERVLAVYDGITMRRLATIPAGIGPTHVAVRGSDAFVVDTQGGALLVFSLRPRVEFVRRANLRGSPYGIAFDPMRGRMWVTLTARNELVEVTADRRPRVLRRLPTIRQPDSVAVDRAGEVAVSGSSAGVLQLVDPSG